MQEESVMFDIQGILVSLDVAERYFCCDLDACHGDCCIEGDAGAPVTEAECEALRRVLPEIIDDLLPAARREIEEKGVAYVDEEGDLVTSIVDGRNCVFTTMAPGGMCQCAVEKAYREGRIDFRKPISCYLYPVRVDRYPTCTAVNYHRWKICKAARQMDAGWGCAFMNSCASRLLRHSERSGMMNSVLHARLIWNSRTRCK